MPKLWKLASIKKGNKRNFESNGLTTAIAAKVAKADMKKELKTKKNNYEFDFKEY